MNNIGNAVLQTLATSAVADGIVQIKTDLTLGLVLVGVGIVLYLVYEFTPAKQ